MVKIMTQINWKSLIIGAAISATIVILASKGNDLLYGFTAIGLLYVGYEAINLKYGAILGAVASTPLIILALDGTIGPLTGFYATDLGIMAIMITVLLVGALIGFVGAYAKQSREKAKIEYEKQQKSGKNKKQKSTTKNIKKN